ncbi:MAG: hypothetical protein KF805_08420 [Phycisphaeraceae bacterium]|nr:hypothetical protein [Phycisphaeraceae bacterium]
MDVPALRDRKRLHEDLQWIWEGFFELSDARACGFSACTIAVSDVTAWLDLSGFEGEARGFFWRMVRRMDAVMLAISRERTNHATQATVGEDRGKRGESRR